jgi:hypothetical protein
VLVVGGVVVCLLLVMRMVGLVVVMGLPACLVGPMMGPQVCLLLVMRMVGCLLLLVVVGVVRVVRVVGCLLLLVVVGVVGCLLLLMSCWNERRWRCRGDGG